MADFGRDPCSSESYTASQFFVFFCQVNNTWLYWFPVSQISRNLNTTQWFTTTTQLGRWVSSVQLHLLQFTTYTENSFWRASRPFFWTLLHCNVFYFISSTYRDTQSVWFDYFCGWTLFVILASREPAERNQRPSIKMMDEERIRPGHWLWSVSWVSFSDLTLFVGWREGRPAC